MSEIKVSYAPPSGKPLGVNPTFRFGASVLIPLLRLITKRSWNGVENLPKSGPAIVISNHLSYIDVLLLTFFLYKNGRAPRYLGKEGIFKVPVLGKILLAAGQIPVQRESATASDALKHAVALIKAGHLVGVYPEGTLTRDADHWPMVAKTGLARLAIITRAPVIPVVQWGTQIAMPTYGKKIKLFPRTKITLVCGQPLDFSPWYGMESDQQALVEATAYAMRELTTMLEAIRGEKRPVAIFDPHKSDLPRTGNFKKEKKK
jgi:1-acyl-sn-glycerol-3-phosphate acyltransferase